MSELCPGYFIKHIFKATTKSLTVKKVFYRTPLDFFSTLSREFKHTNMGTSRTDVREGHLPLGIRRRVRTEFPHFSKQWHSSALDYVQNFWRYFREILSNGSMWVKFSPVQYIRISFWDWRDTKRIVTSGREASISCRFVASTSIVIVFGHGALWASSDPRARSCITLSEIWKSNRKELNVTYWFWSEGSLLLSLKRVWNYCCRA